MKRWLRRILALLALSLVGSVTSVYFIGKRSLPEINGKVAAPGLAAPVRVVRDTFGVPHFYAENLSDLAFAVGYVQAQDRLLQIDLAVHLVSGTLSEVVGADTAELDYANRTIGFRRWGMLAFKKLPAEDRALLQ